MRVSEDGAFTARHVMPLAMRPLREKSGALLAHFTSALGTHTVAADFQEAASRL